ncbi:Uncharacterized protein MA16_Dca027281 [Dendrobium catenatum]|uniref:Splicing factor 3B subunit 5 n=1 Tax=Dendrobium catenatum TaxID=906689 RepID=A0A2I0VGH9_9ASPA|nr:Uncharacterized protein MA16_Dca027281 [Dendrobium catenatum]
MVEFERGRRSLEGILRECGEGFHTVSQVSLHLSTIGFKAYLEGSFGRRRSLWYQRTRLLRRTGEVCKAKPSPFPFALRDFLKFFLRQLICPRKHAGVMEEIEKSTVRGDIVWMRMRMNSFTLNLKQNVKYLASDRFNINSQLEHLQAKYVGTGHSDMNRFEWAVNIQRDSYASYVGHYPILAYFAIAENESIGRERYNFMQVSI